MEPALRNPPQEQANERQSNRQRALQLLDIDSLQLAESETQDLATEVDSYLAIPPTKIGIIPYWQVCVILVLMNST